MMHGAILRCDNIVSSRPTIRSRDRSGLTMIEMAPTTGDQAFRWAIEGGDREVEEKTA
jgi:hypothetical protein